MIKLGLDMERMRNPYSGLAVYCKGLSGALSKIKDLECTFFYPANHPQTNSKNDTYAGSGSKVFGIHAPKLQLFHATHQNSKLYVRGIPRVTTLHDLNFIEKYKNNRIKRTFAIWTLNRLIQKSSAINYISNYTKMMAEEYLNNRFLKNTRVIYNGVDFNPANIKTPFVAPETFFFSIGVINPKKNFHVLLPLVKKTGIPIVIAGIDTHAYVAKIKSLAEKEQIASLVHIIGPVSSEEKNWYYKHCKALLFPSLSEGFGYPIIEAMSYGKPVFLSRLTSMPEIGSSFAYYFDSFEANSMFNVLQNGLDTEINHPTFSQERIQYASQFTWAAAANQYFKMYQSVL